MTWSITKIIVLVMVSLLLASTFGGLIFSVLKGWLMNSFVDYINTSKGLNTALLVIIIIGAINFILLNFFVRKRFSKAVAESKKRKLQQEKIDRLSPKKSEDKWNTLYLHYEDQLEGHFMARRILGHEDT